MYWRTLKQAWRSKVNFCYSCQSFVRVDVSSYHDTWLCCLAPHYYITGEWGMGMAKELVDEYTARLPDRHHSLVCILKLQYMQLRQMSHA
uniref:Uncharacterized protein n=1 Tax=Anguilla anguilla TaxID=7936 RepID=A0A0E9VSR5_ANGAN